MCNYNGVCPISSGCGYYHFPCCCQHRQRQCMPCYNRTRLAPKPTTTANLSCLSKRAKVKTTLDATVKENIVCPRQTTTGVCKARCAAPCNTQNAKTRKLHYPSGPLHRRLARHVSPNTEIVEPLEAAKSPNEIGVLEVARTRRRSRSLKPKPKKSESQANADNDRPKSGEDGLWFQCAVPVRVNVPNLMVMPPELMTSKATKVAALNSPNTTNALSVLPSNFQSQTNCGGPTMPCFCVYFKQPQEALLAPKKTCNEIETQTPATETTDVAASTPPTTTNCLSRRKRACKCGKRKSKRPIVDESTQCEPQTTSSSTPQKDDGLARNSSLSTQVAACGSSAQSSSKRSVELSDDSGESHRVKATSSKRSASQHSESNKSLSGKSSSHGAMVKRDLSDLYRICKSLETREYCPKADRRSSYASLNQQTKSEASYGWRQKSHSLNHLPAIRPCSASQSVISTIRTCNIKRNICSRCVARRTIAKTKSKTRQMESYPSATRDSISSKWQPVLQLIEDIVADKLPENANSSITSTTPPPGRCTSAQRHLTAKRSAKRKARKTASCLEGDKQSLASKATNSQFVGCAHCAPSISCNEDRLKAALEKRPFVLVPYQMTAAHEAMPECDSKHVFAVCLPCATGGQLNCSQTACHEEAIEKVAEDDKAEHLHTTAILMPRPLSSDSNIRPPSYACSQTNHREAHNYEETVLYETTTVCSLQNLIQACSRPPANMVGCTFMANQQFSHNTPLTNPTMHSSQPAVHYRRPSEGASVGNDFSGGGNEMPTSNSNQQFNRCPCCSSYCRCNSQPMMASTSVRQMPIGFYQQTAQKYGIQIMDSFFRSQPTCDNYCQMQYKQQHHHHQQFASDVNAKREPFLKQTPTQKTLILSNCAGNKCPCLGSYGGHCFR